MGGDVTNKGERYWVYLSSVHIFKWLKQWLRMQQCMAEEGKWRKPDIQGRGCHFKELGFYSLGRKSFGSVEYLYQIYLKKKRILRMIDSAGLEGGKETPWDRIELKDLSGKLDFVELVSILRNCL